MRVFLRDRFTDRYSGTRLFNPGVLRLLSHRLGDSFPFQKNWKLSETHPMYWELFPTLDHRAPVSRGGADVEENWITTSMVRNSAKAHWTLAELGWREWRLDELGQWDGLTKWLIDFTQSNPDLCDEPYVRRWAKASARALAPTRKALGE